MIIPEQHIIFGGETLGLHDALRQEMLQIYKDGDYRIETYQGKVDFIDSEAKELFQEGVEFFQENSLGSKHFIEQNLDTFIFSWMGDKVVNTLTGILISEGFKANNYAGVIEVKDATKADVER